MHIAKSVIMNGEKYHNIWRNDELQAQILNVSNKINSTFIYLFIYH